MKKLALFLLVFISVKCYSQHNIVDTTKKDTLYAVVLKKNEFEWLVNLIKQQDEKPSVIKTQIELLYQKTQFAFPKESAKTSK